MTKIHELARLGQSIWYDNIRRGILDSGEFQALLDDGILGVTSNPSIFEKAIAQSNDYDEAMNALIEQGRSVTEIYETLAMEDIGRAADMLRAVYEQTQGVDGYVSLEVSPLLANETEQTIAEARRLFAALDRPNIMIKVPATPAGILAIETLIGEGININVTLIFSLKQYEAVAEAYLKGLEVLASTGSDVGRVASVASFFVSRVDSTVDARLASKGNTELQGKVAVANSRVVYKRFKEIYAGRRWDDLSAKGARVQRPLWASTSTKNPDYPDTLYIDALIGANTVNTVPPATLGALLDHGTIAPTIEVDVLEAQAQLDALTALGIDLDAVTQQLQDAGVEAFARSFESLMNSVESKRELLLARNNLRGMGALRTDVDSALLSLTQNHIVRRIWDHDHTVWKPEPDEISNRLNWLHLPETMRAHIDEVNAFFEGVLADGFTHAVLLGMGGSSLAPEVFGKVFDSPGKGLSLSVLDSTDPGAVAAKLDEHDLRKTLFIVSTKSGGTVETLSFFKFFYNRVLELVGSDGAGWHFIAITDPGSKLELLATQYRFRKTFLNDPEVGGRNSALSLFGLVPAALVGVDLTRLLNSAALMAGLCRADVAAENPAALLGSVMGAMATLGRDKMTLVASAEITCVGDWIEQLVAESTGKDSLGILPVVGEPLGSPDVYGNDRLFVSITLGDDLAHERGLDALEAAGHPVIRLQMTDRYDLGKHFLLWEIATAIAGHLMGINPFDQPDVEAAKVMAREAVKAFGETGQLPAVEAAAPSLDVLRQFLGATESGDYIALQAYVNPTRETTAALQTLRLRLRENYRLATTVGYGPRFLHSTGQLHKGDRGNGLFVQFVASHAHDVSIPDEAGQSAAALTFGTLEQAQADGDRAALLSVNRRVIRFDLGTDVVAGIRALL